MVLLVACAGQSAPAPTGASLEALDSANAWVFSRQTGWQGWQPNGEVRDVRFEPECVVFQTIGADPSIVGPPFAPIKARNSARVEIEIDCNAPGSGELYFAKSSAGRDGGFQAKWYVPVGVPQSGRRVIRVWPFWESLGEVVRIRFDPPTGVHCRLYSIRIVDEIGVAESEASPGSLPPGSWQALHAVTLEHSDSSLRARAEGAMAVLIAPVRPFDAARRSILELDAHVPGEHVICLYWATREEAGLWGEPIELSPAGATPPRIDLRQYPEWKGTITHLGIGFGSRGGEVLAVRSLRVYENEPNAPFLRLRYLGYAAGVGRPRRAAPVRAILQHAGGPPMPACDAVFSTDANALVADASVPLGPLNLGQSTELNTRIEPRAHGETQLSLKIGKQRFTRTLKVEPPISEVRLDEYAVRPPRPVSTEARIGAYYWPGWSDPQMGAWKMLAGLPERDPLLGWYREGRPEVADWHIKWALENGISFFVYDWYWYDGREHSGAALNEGFLNARYQHLMQFALMWANHRPLSENPAGQLLAVTDYWIERYLRRPNYLRVDGVPYVSMYSPHQLLTDFGTPEKLRTALEAMRERAKAAGLPGLHIGAIDIAGQVAPATLGDAGFDSLTSYTYIRTGATPVAHTLYRPYLLGYEDVWSRLSRDGSLPYIPALSIGWDGPVWYGPRSERRLGRRTADFEQALGRLKAYLTLTGGKLAILEAWNEWSEGAYLEPNVEFGFGDLEAVRRTFARPGDWPVNIGPEDVGQSGRYDQRLGPASSPAPQ